MPTEVYLCSLQRNSILKYVQKNVKNNVDPNIATKHPLPHHNEGTIVDPGGSQGPVPIPPLLFRNGYACIVKKSCVKIYFLHKKVSTKNTCIKIINYSKTKN